MSLDDLSRLLVVVAVVNVSLTSVLVAAALRHHWPALEERATVAVLLAVIAVGAAVLGLVRLKVLALTNEQSLVILGAGLLLVSAPSIIWAVAYWTGRFDEPDASGGRGRP